MLMLMAWYRPWEGRKYIRMEYTVFCCNLDQPCKVYNMPTKKFWKRLYFLDTCAICGQPVAAIWECSIDGTLSLIVRKSGKKAEVLRDKILSKKINDFEIMRGAASNEKIYYNNRGVIYNFNNRKIATQEKFLSYTHS